MMALSKAMLRWKPVRRDAPHRSRLGEILLRRNLISESALAEAMLLRQQTGSRLGDVLIGQGLISYYDLYHAVAEYHGLPFADLLKEPPDVELMHAADAPVYLRFGIVPWRVTQEHIFFATCNVTPDIQGWITARYGDQAKLVITSPFDIRRAIETQFGASLEEASRLSLWEKLPLASARITLLPRQQKILYVLLGLVCGVAITAPLEAALAFILLCHLLYAVTMLFKVAVFFSGARATSVIDWPEKLAPLTARTLPVYTVIIPMYKEAATLPRMLESMKNLDYPPSKLDIKLLLEMDDGETLAAAQALRPHYQFEILRVPPGNPRTKPKACNYALHFARGEFLTIFDAEDRPEPLQLKKAVYMFRHLPEDVACLQAPLNYYNANDNLLTRFFSLEYTILFRTMLRGLERIGIPIPLGGTSNHIALSRLRELGAWDPFNVTEDADLGTRLAARGLRTAMLDSYTMEEATNRWHPWIKQRSRWIKGYMQTWLVHMRHPGALYKALGAKSFFGFQCFIGMSSFTFLTAPLVWALSLLWVFGLVQQVPLPSWLAWLMIANLFLNLITQWAFALHAARLYRDCAYQRAVTLAAILYPLYLIGHSLASYKAFWQLIFRPHFWEKTTHGVSRHIDPVALDTGLLK